MCRSVPIEGSATPIMETSRPSRKSAPHSTNSVPHNRGVHTWLGRALSGRAGIEVMVLKLHAHAFNAQANNAVTKNALTWYAVGHGRARTRGRLAGPRRLVQLRALRPGPGARRAARPGHERGRGARPAGRGPRARA